jgi:hypothetical protein
MTPSSRMFGFLVDPVHGAVDLHRVKTIEGAELPSRQ